MGKLEQLISDTFAIMIPQQAEPVADNNICTLKKCAIRSRESKEIDRQNRTHQIQANTNCRTTRNVLTTICSHG